MLGASLVFPPGVSLDYWGTTAPAGWHFEDGAALSRTTYAALFAVLGTTYGAGDGSTTFNLPDSRGRTTVNKATSGTFGTLGAKVGEATHTLTIAEMPAHTHNTKTDDMGPASGFTDANHSAMRSSAANYTLYSAVTDNTGGGGAHNNVQPSIVSNRIISLGPLGTPDEPAAGEVLPDAAVWQPGQSIWDFLNPLVQSVGKRLWCDESRNWHLSDPLDGSSGSVNLTSILTQAADTIDRSERWYDSVVVHYGNDDVYDVAGPTEHTRTLTVEYKDASFPGSGAAASILTRVKGRGRALTPQAVSRYDIEPGKTAVVALPDTPLQTGVVASVTWRLPDDEMTVGTRDLTDATPYSWTAQPEGQAWTDVAAGTSWTEYEP